ncbi:ferritin family protein [Methanomethylovorans sp.]|uniref:ferritin family protein n=1 Tax=Methanomethylovorans sp. TaxID=2758717 RepID=UPI000AAB37D2|nr:ferritin family protein [Methanomethylovorans sp.]
MKDVLEEISEQLDQLDTLEEAIDVAIKLEEDGMAYYLEKSGSMTNPAAREMYAFLAEEEKKHAEMLRKFKNGDKKAAHVKHHFPDFTPSLTQEFSDKKLEEIGILLAALRFEYKSEYFYMELGRRATDPEQKEFFDRIAAAEREHYRLIDEMLQASTEFRMQT